MANEFIARNGLISQNNSTITGSLTVTGGITGSLFGTSSRAVTASFATFAGTATTATTVSSIAGNVTSNGDNYILTATGGTTINGEATLQFDGTTLTATGRLAQGESLTATGDFSHAEGDTTIAFGDYSHAEGQNTLSLGSRSHAEGYNTSTGTQYAFHAGVDASISAGVVTIDSVYGNISGIFAVGNFLFFDDGLYDDNYGRIVRRIVDVTWDSTNTTVRLDDESIATTQAIVGDPKFITSWASYGGNSAIPGTHSHAEGTSTTTLGLFTHAEGAGTVAVGNSSHAEGNSSKTLGIYSHAEGFSTTAQGEGSHAEGNGTEAVGAYTHTEGYATATYTLGYLATSVVSGVITIDGIYGNVKPYLIDTSYIVLYDDEFDAVYGTKVFQVAGIDGTTPTVINLVDTSVNTTKAYIGSPVNRTPTGANRVIPSIESSHAEGFITTAIGPGSHAEGVNTFALGQYSHAEGEGTVTVAPTQHASGIFNLPILDESAFIVGNGTGNTTRSNLFVASGNTVSVTGSLNVSSTATATGGFIKPGAGSQYLLADGTTTAGGSSGGDSTSLGLVQAFAVGLQNIF